MCDVCRALGRLLHRPMDAAPCDLPIPSKEPADEVKLFCSRPYDSCVCLLAWERREGISTY
jgi:hypothetical protein